MFFCCYNEEYGKDIKSANDKFICLIMTQIEHINLIKLDQ
jgi:hypothetical protein